MVDWYFREVLDDGFAAVTTPALAHPPTAHSGQAREKYQSTILDGERAAAVRLCRADRDG
jgi:hypothetical protein